MSLAGRLRKWTLIALALIVLIGIGGAVAVRVILARSLDIQGPGTARESGYVTIGGQPQWVEIRGWDRTNPVLLWVHGGPGLPVLSAGYSSFLPWERHFTIVHWRQRGAGLTYAAGYRPVHQPGGRRARSLRGGDGQGDA